MELDDHADLDAQAAQPLDLLLQVGDVDGGDPALVAAAPPRARSPCRRAAAAPSAPSSSRERLPEPEHVPVERPAGLEVADAVPDAHGPGRLERDRPGATSQRRALQPSVGGSRPRSRRRSSGGRRSASSSSSAGRRSRRVDHDRPFLDRADGEDRRLRRVEDGDELLDAVHAEVRDRERAALEIGRLELPVAGAADDVGAGGGDLGDGLRLAAAGSPGRGGRARSRRRSRRSPRGAARSRRRRRARSPRGGA